MSGAEEASSITGATYKQMADGSLGMQCMAVGRFVKNMTKQEPQVISRESGGKLVRVSNLRSSSVVAALN